MYLLMIHFYLMNYLLFPWQFNISLNSIDSILIVIHLNFFKEKHLQIRISIPIQL